jgi:two-component system alkaline phosphatase synthesis response regulator PhoP
VLTAKGSEIDRVLGLEMGADDYIVKPFSPREVVARVKALLRRANAASEQLVPALFERGRLKMDFGTYEVFVDCEKKELALREFELLRFFVQHPLRVYSREQLLDLVWGRDTFVEPRTIDVHVRRLRQQIERDDSNPELILTVRSVGYRFNPDALG